MDALPRALERVLWEAHRTRVARIDRIEEARWWQTAVSPETPQSSAFQVSLIREGCGKSKWKFKMAFAMKGGGSRGGLECHIPILKNDFC